MIYQLIYGKNPSLGYRELKYSAGVMTDEYMDSRMLNAFKAGFGLSDNVFDTEGETPTCVYFISEDIDGKAVCTIGKVSFEIQNGETTELSHFYFFTSFDAYDAITADSQSSVFNLKSFVPTYGKVSAYDIDSNKIYNANNTFSIENIKASLEYMGIDRNLYKNILHKVFLSLQTNKKIIIVSDKDVVGFTKNALGLMRSIFYLLPGYFLRNFGFVTFLRNVSDISLTDESTRIIVVDNNEKNQSEFKNLFENGNYVIDFDSETDNVIYGTGFLLELMASIIFDFADKDMLVGFYNHFNKYIKDSTNKDYNLYELLYRHYTAIAANTGGIGLKEIYNELLEHADKLQDNIFKEVSIETIEALKESIENVSFESEKPAGLESIFVKLKTISNYSDDMFLDESFMLSLKNKLNQAFSVADYLLLKKYYELSTKLESEINEIVAANLNKIKAEVINSTFSAVKNQDISNNDKVSIESWPDEQLALMNEVNRKKIYDVFIGKSLFSSLNDPSTFNDLLVEFKNEINASGYLKSRLAECRETLVGRYQDCVDAKGIRIYFQIFAIIFDNNIDLFKIIFDKDGLYELMLYIKVLEDKTSIEDINFIGEVLENFNSSKMKKDVKAFFAEEKYKYELEKAIRIDKNVESFAKRFKLLDTGKKSWFSKG